MKRAATALILATLVIASCSKPEDKFVGHYDGELNIPQQMIDAMKAMASSFGGNPEEVEARIVDGKIGPELRGDGTCTMSGSSGGEGDSMDGTWTLNEEATQITLQLAEAEEKASEIGLPSAGENLVLDVSEDGKTLSFGGRQMGMAVGTAFT
ncbi:MAG: hypothetical protein IIA44_09515, partial [Acidobacteria bacterium]|nr:hypothetical protein [Acidobacteriota bacterium]